MRVLYNNKDGFLFNLFKRHILDRLSGGMLNRISKKKQAKNIIVGNPEFDRYFRIESNDEYKALELFANTRIQHLIKSKGYRVEARDYDASDHDVFVWGDDRFVFLSQSVSELCITVPRGIYSVEEFKSPLWLLEEMLNHLYKMGSASEIRLRTPQERRKYRVRIRKARRF